VQLQLANTAVQSLAQSAAPPRPATRIPDPEIQPPAKAAPLEIVKATSARAEDIPESFKVAMASPQEPTSQPARPKAKKATKAAAATRVPTEQPKEAKASTRTKGQAKGQESPETKVSTRMVTRKQAKDASRAGGLRSGGGSGKTDTCVAQGNPSKT
jgi:hypothetical protein